MAIVVIEKVESRRYINDHSKMWTFERVYTITGSNNISDVFTAGPAIGTGPTDLTGVFSGFIGVVVRKEYTPTQNQSAVEGGEGAWELRVTYEYGLMELTGKDKYQWDTSAEQVNIKRAFAQTHYPNAAPATDIGDLVGVTEGEIEGVDVYTPKGELIERYRDVTLSEAQRAEIMIITGTTNNATWRGFYRGEVLFAGGVSVQQPDGKWDITYRFLVSRHSEDKSGAGDGNDKVDRTLTIETMDGGAQTVSKRGWEYLWY
ncbi:hypothetical protein LCGC14_2723910, partial [marine sediment metagenome]